MVVDSSPESVERETSHGMVQGSMLKQGVNFPSDLSDTVTQTSRGIDTVMAETWEAQCETSPDLALSRFWELEQEQVTDGQGKLKAHLSFWELKLQPAPWIIRECYKLPLLSIPEIFIRPNQASALANREFVIKAISELVQTDMWLRSQTNHTSIVLSQWFLTVGISNDWL